MCLSRVSACCGRDISLGFIILLKYFFPPLPWSKKLLTLLCTSKKQRVVIAAHLVALVRFPALIRIRSQFRRQVSIRELAAPLQNPSLIPEKPKRKPDSVKTMRTTSSRPFPHLVRIATARTYEGQKTRRNPLDSLGSRGMVSGAPSLV